jgi:putative tryptophan/tyrosine transport system substrate-binding protein
MDRRGSRLSRRAFVVGAGAAGLGLVAGCGRLPFQASLITRTPEPARVYRLGFLSSSDPGFLERPAGQAFLIELRDRGYAETENLLIEYRWADGNLNRLPDLAADLVRLRVDAIVAHGDAAQAAKETSSTIPIVMTNSPDPVGSGLVAGLARPGGNVTGVSTLTVGVSAKRLELLKETVPGISHIAVLWNRGSPSAEQERRELQDAAPALSLQLQSVGVHAPTDLETVLGALLGERPEALFIVPDSYFAGSQLPVLARFAAKNRLPSIYAFREAVAAGGLMAYGPSLSGMFRRAVYYVDRILKGTKPADLPVEQPMTFDFVVNLKTAQALGITFPNEILLQVTEVIQ